MRSFRQAMVVLACSLAWAGVARADVIDTAEYADYYPGSTWHNGLYPDGLPPVNGVSPVYFGNSWGDEGYVWVSKLEQKITLPGTAKLNSITIATEDNTFPPAMWATIGGQTFATTKVQYFSAGNQNYIYHTISLQGIVVAPDLSITISGDNYNVGLSGINQTPSNVSNAIRHLGGIPGDDYNQGVRTPSVFQDEVLSNALMFSLNYTPVTAVPEPETYLMMLSGVAVLAGAARRRRKAAAKVA